MQDYPSAQGASEKSELWTSEEWLVMYFNRENFGNSEA